MTITKERSPNLQESNVSPDSAATGKLDMDSVQGLEGVTDCSSDPQAGQVESDPRQDGKARSSRTGQPKKKKAGAGDWNLSRFVVEPEEGKTRFHDLDLPIELMHAIDDLEFQFCTPIQAAALPQAITGRDLVAKASTGTGKSAVFLIAAFTRLLQTEQLTRRPGRPRVLVIARPANWSSNWPKTPRGWLNILILRSLPPMAESITRNSVNGYRNVLWISWRRPPDVSWIMWARVWSISLRC